jgi:predicted lactoylglutathione lyase
MKIKNIRTFLPSKDVKVSKQFYLDLGFNITWQDDELIIFGDEDYSFFLQKYYNKDWAENVMMQLFVDDLDSLNKVAKALMQKYEGIKVNDIFTADYGRTFHLIDPAGVLWHMTETTKK